MDFCLDIPVTVHFPRCCKKGCNSESYTTQANANLRLGPLVPPMARVLLGRTRNYEKKIISYRSISILGSKGISVVRA